LGETVSEEDETLREITGGVAVRERREVVDTLLFRAIMLVFIEVSFC
jgi:hypothetical protein